MKRTNMKTIDRAFDKCYERLVTGDDEYEPLLHFRETIYRQLLKARKEAYQEGYEDGYEDAHNHIQLISKWSSNGDK